MKKTFRTVMTGVMLVILTSAGYVAYAHDQSPEKMTESIATLEQASGELRSSDSALADKLQKMADNKKKWMAKEEKEKTNS